MTQAPARERAQLDAALLEMLQAFVARAPLFAELRARGEADDLIQDALIAVGARLDDIADPFAYATRVVQNLARRAYARARPEMAVDTAQLEAAGSVADVAELAERRFELEEVLGMVRAVTLIVCDLPPADVELVRAELRRDDQRALARRLGMSRATLYRRKRDVLGEFVNAVAHGARAEPCPDRVDALLAAAGGSGFASARRAREHAESCVECSTTLRHLTAARHGLAVLSPLPALGVVDDAAFDRIALGAHGLWEWLRSVALRGPDPSAAFPVSKGAAAAIAAACVGVGGTTYCAVDGLPAPVRDALGIPGHRVERPPAAGRRPQRRSPPPAPAQVSARRPESPRKAGTTAAVVPARTAEFHRRSRGSGEAEFASPAHPRAVAAGAASSPPAAVTDTAAQEFRSGPADDEFG